MKRSTVLGAALGLMTYATYSTAFADNEKPNHFELEPGAIEDVLEHEKPNEDVLENLAVQPEPAMPALTPAAQPLVEKTVEKTVGKAAEKAVEKAIVPALPEQPVMDKIVNESAYAVCKEDFDQVTGLYNVAKNLYGSVQKSIEKVNGLQQKQTTYIKSAPEPEVKRLLKFREKQEKFKGEMDANIQVYTNHLQKFQRAYDALVKDGCGARKRQTELSAINVDLEKKINKEDAEYIFENKTDHAGDFLGLRSRVDRVEDRLDAYFVSTRMGYAKVFDEPSTQGVYLAAEAPVSGSVNLGLAGLLGGRSFRPHTSTSTVASADGQVDLITKTTNERDDFSWGVGAGGTIYPLSEAGIHLDTLVVWKEQKVRREIVSELQQNGRMMPGSRSQPYVQANGHQQWRLAPAVGVVIAPVGGLEVFGNLRGYVDGDRGDNLVTNFGIEAGLGYRFGI